MLRYRVRRRRIRLATVWLAVAAAGPLLTVAGPLLAGAAQGAGRPVVVVAEIDALIHPVSAEFIAQAISRADDEDAELVVLVLRTPGGLVDSTRDINTSIIESETPVVVYVGPSGTRAASAGFLITIAADIAAMAPGTHIGAAHPVSGSGQAMDETAAEKAASDVAAYARSLASQRERNVELAEKAVTDSQSFTEREALEAEPPLIDLVAADLDALIDQLDGREVRRWDGDAVTLRTAGARIIPVDDRPPLPDDMRQWMGDSRGYWDGDTLVVEVGNYTDKTIIHPTRGAPSQFQHSRDLRVVERFTPVDPVTIEYQVTIQDPRTFTSDWTVVIPMTTEGAPTEILEYACQEGQQAVRNILSGARAQERRAAEAAR